MTGKLATAMRSSRTSTCPDPFCWIVIASFREIARARRRVGEDPFLRVVVDGTEAGLVAFLAAGLVQWTLGDSEILALLFFFLGTAIAAGQLARREKAGGAA